MLSCSVIAVILAAFVGGDGPAPPPEAPAVEPGVFVTVDSPITSSVVNQIKESLASATKQRPLKKIVFDFNPDGKEAASADFGPCLDLARYIRSLRNESQMLTVAYVRNKCTRHTVLPILACDEMVMAPDGVLGPVATNAGATPDVIELANYEKFARPDQAALVVKMLDASAAILEGRKNGVWYVDARNEAAAAQAGVTIADRKPVLPAGALGAYRALEAQKFQLCKAILASRQQVEERYSMPPGSHREDLLFDRQRSAWRISVRGEINSSLEGMLHRQLDRATRAGGNIIILQLECGGGRTDVAINLADYIRGLRSPDGRRVMTIAFIPYAAPDNATFLALGCRQIVMTKAARLGDFTGLLNPPRPRRGPVPPRPDINIVRQPLVQLADSQHYAGLLMRGLLEPDLEIVRAKRVQGAGIERRFLTPDELQEKDADGKDVWEAEDTIKHPGQLLVVTGANAVSLGLARYIVDKPDDIAELYRIYALDSKDVREAGSDWLDKFAMFFADPFVSAFLVLVGISCLLIELKMPGASAPGIVAAVCFVIFFWSQSQLNGQITLLAVLLFLLGLLLLGLEIFVIPGFGVFGFSGVALIIFSLALATMERMPQSSEEWGMLGAAVVKFALALVGAMTASFTVARFLPQIPIANRLVLQSPNDPDAPPDPYQTALAEEQLALLGAIGTAATMLRPAGMAQFGDKFLDVVSDGGFVHPGAQVRVIEIEGNRIVVKEV